MTGSSIGSEAGPTAADAGRDHSPDAPHPCGPDVAHPHEEADEVGSLLPTKELRIALALNGGVSLAVWMGGVAYEINRLLRRDDPVFRDIARTLAIDPRVDVLAGSSAGGINGAMLAAALVHNQPLHGIREMWASEGSLGRMLRSPVSSDVPSLLDGDGVFLPALQKAFDLLCTPAPTRAATAGEGEPPVDLLITTTLLAGTPGLFPDDFGNVLVEPEHHGTFRFDRSQLQAADASRKLALAARCSASYPGAFEASFCPVGQDGYDSESNRLVGGARRPDMAGILQPGATQYTIDGGVLVNKPVAPALELIAGRSASQPVRRVLVYVNPAPADPPSGQAAGASGPPSLAQVLRATAMLPRTESLVATLTDLREHNQRVALRRQRRDDLALALAGLPLSGDRSDAAVRAAPDAGDQLRNQALGLFRVYSNGRRLAAIPHITRRLMHAAAPLLGTPAEARISSPVYDVRQFMRVMEAASTSAPWAPAARAEGQGLPIEDPARWGLRPIERSAEVLVDLLKRAQTLPEVAAGADLRKGLGGLRRRVHELLDVLSGLRRLDEKHWDDPGQAREAVSWLAQLSSPQCGPEERAEATRRLEAWAKGRMDTWLEDPVPGSMAANTWGTSPPPSPPMNGRAALASVAGQLAAIARETVTQLSPALQAPPGGMAYRRADGWPVRATAAVLSPETPERGEDSAWLRQLLALDVCLHAYDEGGRELGQEVELMQLSAQGADAFGQANTPEEKLAGLQIAHFGAFYKRSWRYNDWMWGRLDGAARLVQLLLEPERLRDAARQAADQVRPPDEPRTPVDIAAEWVRSWALDDPDAGASAQLTSYWNFGGDRRSEREQVHDELRFCLAEQPPPATLPASVLAVTRRIQLGILREEMPYLDAAALADARGEDAAEPPIRDLPPYPPEDAIRAFKTSDVRRERITDDAQSDRFLLLASQAAAVAATAVSAPAAGLGVARRLLRPIRGGALTAWYMARGVTKQSSAATILTLAMLAVGGALVAVAVLQGNLAHPAVTASLGGAAVVLGVLRLGPLRASALLAVAVGAVAVLLLLPRFVTPVASHDYTDWRVVVLAGRTPLIVLICVVALFLLGGTGARWTSGDAARVGVAVLLLVIVGTLTWAIPHKVSRWQARSADHRLQRYVAAGLPVLRGATVSDCVTGRLRPEGVVDTELAVQPGDHAGLWLFANGERARAFADRQRKAAALAVPAHVRACVPPPSGGAVEWVVRGSTVVELATTDSAVAHQQQLLGLVGARFGLG